MAKTHRADLARAIRARRKELGLTQARLAQDAGISTSAVQKLEDPTSTVERPRTVPNIERALRWAPGTGDAILRGETPPAPAVPPTAKQPEPPVAQGIDPQLLLELATATPEQLQRVHDFLRGIKEGNR